MLGSDVDKTIYGVFDARFLVASVCTSIIGAWAAVNVMEAFRTEKKHKTRAVMLLAFGFLVGGVSIWAMHFTGMFAFSLMTDFDIYNASSGEAIPQTCSVPMNYNVGMTAFSFFCASLLVFCGAYVASTDVFFGASNEEAVSALQSMIELKKLMKVGKRVKFIALFKRPQRLIAGGVIAGVGVCIMHFAGMGAIDQNGFKIEWKVVNFVMSCLIAVTVASAGFWIVFRLLQWRPNSELIRFGSAVVIAVAVCSMHYTGMTAAKYIATNETHDASGVATVEALFDIGMVCSVLVIVIGFSGLVINMRKSIHLYRDELTEELIGMIEAELKRSRNYEELQRNLSRNIVQVLKVRTVKTGKSTNANAQSSATTSMENIAKKAKAKATSKVTPSTPDNAFDPSN